jgi:hypothetical protein
MPLEPEFDLHWTAFLYVSGELTIDESTSFESLLAEDQEAREAVALAVELAQALAIVGPLPRSVSRKRNYRRVLAWAGSMAAAACLAVAILPILRPVVPTESQGDTSSVALAWSGLRVGTDPDWTAFVSGVQAPESPVAGSLAEIENADEAESSNERPLPSWLLLAASVPSGDSPQEEN